MKKKGKIYIDHWLNFKPYTNETNVDLYYLKLCNKVYQNISSESYFALLMLTEDDNIIKELCCFLVCYFEDVISETNFWMSFKEKHNELYNKPLPFYEVDKSYINEEINHQDIAFLIWYYINCMIEDRFTSPYNSFITDIANTTLKILDDAYEYAPENEKLKLEYNFNPKSDSVLYEARDFTKKILLDSYLFYPDTKYRYLIDLEETMDGFNDYNENSAYKLDATLREHEEAYSYQEKTKLLALTGKEWASLILGKDHPYHSSFNTLSKKINGFFLYKSQNNTSITVEHIASSLVFKITKKSFDHADELKEDDIMLLGIVKWENEWWFSGSFAKYAFNADIILNEKNSHASRASVTFLEDNNDTINAVLQDQKQAFLDCNNGRDIAFKKSSEVKAFTEAFMTRYNENLNLSSDEKIASKERAKQDGYFGENSNGFEEFDTNLDEEAIIFFNPKTGLEIDLYLASIFPDKDNPFYFETTRNTIVDLIVSPEYSKELASFFIKEYKSECEEMLKEEPLKSYLEHLDFIFRFGKYNTYSKQPNIITTGKSKLAST